MQTTLAPNKIEEIFALVDAPAFREDSKKAYKGNKAAIKRVREVELKVGKLCTQGRAELSDIKKNLALTKN